MKAGRLHARMSRSACRSGACSARPGLKRWPHEAGTTVTAGLLATGCFLPPARHLLFTAARMAQHRTARSVRRRRPAAAPAPPERPWRGCARRRRRARTARGGRSMPRRKCRTSRGRRPGCRRAAGLPSRESPASGAAGDSAMPTPAPARSRRPAGGRQVVRLRLVNVPAERVAAGRGVQAAHGVRATAPDVGPVRRGERVGVHEQAVFGHQVDHPAGVGAIADEIAEKRLGLRAFAPRHVGAQRRAPGG